MTPEALIFAAYIGASLTALAWLARLMFRVEHRWQTTDADEAHAAPPRPAGVLTLLCRHCRHRVHYTHPSGRNAARMLHEERDCTARQEAH